MILQNTVLRKIFESKERGCNRKLFIHIDKLHNLYSSQNIIRVTKSRRMTWLVHEKCMTDVRNQFNILFGYPEKRDSLEDLGVDGRIILR
jgi:hypothetical protein